MPITNAKMEYSQFIERNSRNSVIFSKNDRTLTIKFQTDEDCHLSQDDVRAWNDMMREVFEPKPRVADVNDLPTWEEFYKG